MFFPILFSLSSKIFYQFNRPAFSYFAFKPAYKLSVLLVTTALLASASRQWRVVLPLSSLTDTVKMRSLQHGCFLWHASWDGVKQVYYSCPPRCASAASPVASVPRPGGKNCTLKVWGLWDAESQGKEQWMLRIQATGSAVWRTRLLIRNVGTWLKVANAEKWEGHWDTKNENFNNSSNNWKLTIQFSLSRKAG